MHNKNIWSPWRYEYIRKLDDELHHAENMENNKAESGNFIENYFQNPQNDKLNLVVYRNDSGIIFLNRFPYVNGHLLVAIGKPKSDLLQYSKSQRNSLWNLVEIGAELMQDKIKPQGINIGINQGQAGGAGVPQHLHVHIIPRWNGDTNFLSTVANIRVIPASLEIMWEQLTQ